jgi:hypothetical protein
MLRYGQRGRCGRKQTGGNGFDYGFMIGGYSYENDTHRIGLVFAISLVWDLRYS